MNADFAAGMLYCLAAMCLLDIAGVLLAGWRLREPKLRAAPPALLCGCDGCDPICACECHALHPEGK